MTTEAAVSTNAETQTLMARERGHLGAASK